MTKTTAQELILSSLSENGVLRLTLNDTARRNALSNAMLEQLKHRIG